MENRPMVTVREAAEQLGLTVFGIARRLQHGDMRGVKVNPRLWLIPVEEVERWRKLGRIKPGPKPKPAGLRAPKAARRRIRGEMS